MTEIVVVNGKHKCGRFMDIRVNSIKEDDNNTSSLIMGWMIYSICLKCRTILVQGLFIQSNKPVLDIDYVITTDVADEQPPMRGRGSK